METVFNIIRRVIQLKAADTWDEARAVLAKEAIETYIVDYDTIYKSERGNKSGEYLTTVVNCIANDLLSYYSFIKLTGSQDLVSFRNNVTTIVFGDDKIESVSEEYSDRYNYLTCKEVMTSIGHIITPGAKDGIERSFCSIDQTQFLKRSFAEFDGLIVAPLMKASIEAPFVWTTIDSSEYAIWYNLVEQCLFESLLHGKEYFEEFRFKLSKSQDIGINRHLASLIARNFEATSRKYRIRYLTQKDEHD